MFLCHLNFSAVQFRPLGFVGGNLPGLLQVMSAADAYTLRGKSLDGPVEGDLGTVSNFPAAQPSSGAPVGRASSRSRLFGFVWLALVLAGVVAAVVVVTRSPGAAPSLRVAGESLLRAASPPEMQFNVMVRRRRSQSEGRGW